jgi:hypothetical protein
MCHKFLCCRTHVPDVSYSVFPADAACGQALAEVASEVGWLAEQVNNAEDSWKMACGMQMTATQLLEAAARPRSSGVKKGGQQQQQQPKQQNTSDATKQCLLSIGHHIEHSRWPHGTSERVTAAQLWNFVAKSARHRMSGEQLARLHAGIRTQQRQAGGARE